MNERLSPEALKEQAKIDCSKISFPQELDLRDRGVVIRFLSTVVADLSKCIPGFENRAILLVGSVARGTASNNSDIDILPIFPAIDIQAETRFKEAITLILETGYGVQVDGFQNSIHTPMFLDRVNRWRPQLVDDNTVILTDQLETRERIKEILGIGSLGTISEASWTFKSRRNRNLAVPPKRFKGL